MTADDIQRAFIQHKASSQVNSAALENFARGLVHVLKDHHADSSAQELERLLFAIDVENQEFTKLLGANATEFLAFIAKSLRNPEIGA